MTISFAHVPRAMNAIADWAGNVSRVLRGNVNLTRLVAGLKPGDKPVCSAVEAAKESAPNFTGVITHVPTRPTRVDHPTCDVCGYRVIWRVGFHCWGCGHHYHRECLGSYDQHSGVWVCYSCRDKARERCTRDLVLDQELMHTVCRGGPIQTWPLEVKERC